MSRSPITAVRQWLVLAGGGLAFAACIVITTAYADVAPIEIVRWPGDGTLVVIAFVTVVVAFGTFVININFAIKSGGTVDPEPETTPSVPRAGTELDRIVETRLLAPHRSTEERHRVRERLRQTVMQTIQRTAGVSRSRAGELVTRGEWTENATAAAFLGRTDPPHVLRLCEHASSRLVFQHSVRQTTRAIVAHANENEENDHD